MNDCTCLTEEEITKTVRSNYDEFWDHKIVGIRQELFRNEIYFLDITCESKLKYRFVKNKEGKWLFAAIYSDSYCGVNVFALKVLWRIERALNSAELNKYEKLIKLKKEEMEVKTL